MPRPSKRVFLGVAAALALLVPLGVFWGRSLMPDSYSMMDVGYADQGGGEGALGQGGHGSSGSEHHRAGGPGAAVSVAELTGPRDRRPDAVVSLVARQETITLAGRAATAGYTLNHTSPGPLSASVSVTCCR